MPGIAERGIAGRLAAVRARIAASCARAQRAASSVTLVAVSKTRSIEEIREAFATGQRDFGENRVQEAADKTAAGCPGGAVLHLVGHLQTNKARIAAGLFRVIHSIDSDDLMHRVDEAASGTVDLLLQVDLAGEESKFGVEPGALRDLLAAAEKLSRARVVGLMCLPPFDPDPEVVRPYFRRLRELRDSHGGSERLPQLSMGMSHDFEVAIEEGATLVRVGEAIFGPRVKP